MPSGFKGLAVGNEACDFQFSFSEPSFAGSAAQFGSDVRVGINTFTGGYESTSFHSAPPLCVLTTYTATLYPQ